MHSQTHRIASGIILLSIISALMLGPAIASQEPQAEEIILVEGAALNVVTAQEITSKTANPNDVVTFTVDEDLVVSGKVLIRKGTPAAGSVINAERGGYLGKSGKLGIQVESTQTVDDGRLKLRAAKGKEGNDKTNTTAALAIISPFFLFKKGGEAKIAAGTKVTVYVAEEKRFRVEGEKLVVVAPAAVDATMTGGEALVYVYRPSKLMGKALEPSVFVDDLELARMDNGRYFTVKLKPGKHLVHMTSEKKGFAIDMGPGQTYYFRVGIEMGMWKGRGKITLEDPEKAAPEIKQLKFIGQDKIKNTDLVAQPTSEPAKQ